MALVHDRIGVMWRYMTLVHDRIGVIWVLPGCIWPWLGLYRASKPPIDALYSPRRYINGPRMYQLPQVEGLYVAQWNLFWCSC